MTGRRALRRARAALAAIVLGCSSDSVRVELESAPPPGNVPGRLAVRAQVVGPTDGLRYKWFSVAGDLEPQESDWPATVFTFGNGTTKDRVSLDVWKGAVRVAHEELDVVLSEAPARAAAAPPRVEIEITTVPPYEPEGGPDTRAHIAGLVRGEVSPDYRVVIYARADVWYVQPSAFASHRLDARNHWESWTHTGSSYAALLVRPEFEAQSRVDLLPQVGNLVLARVVVDGARK